jgi:hypothetical protein
MKETTWHSYAAALFGAICVCIALAIQNHTPATVSASNGEVTTTDLAQLAPGSWEVIAWGLSTASPDSPEIKFAWAKFQDEQGLYVVPKCQYVIISGTSGVKIHHYQSGTWILVIGEKELT